MVFARKSAVAGNCVAIVSDIVGLVAVAVVAVGTAAVVVVVLVAAAVGTVVAVVAVVASVVDIVAVCRFVTRKETHTAPTRFENGTPAAQPFLSSVPLPVLVRQEHPALTEALPHLYACAQPILRA